MYNCTAYYVYIIMYSRFLYYFLYIYFLSPYIIRAQNTTFRRDDDIDVFITSYNNATKPSDIHKYKLNVNRLKEFFFSHAENAQTPSYM